MTAAIVKVLMALLSGILFAQNPPRRGTMAIPGSVL
jgi:hypothetical protein